MSHVHTTALQPWQQSETLSKKEKKKEGMEGERKGGRGQGKERMRKGDERKRIMFHTYKKLILENNSGQAQ